MSKISKALDRVLRGTADANIRFDNLRALLTHLGFSERIRGDHHIFVRDDVVEILNYSPAAARRRPIKSSRFAG